MASVVVGPAQFNRGLAVHGSKAAVHYAGIRPAAQADLGSRLRRGVTLVRGDKHGGRHFYLQSLYQSFPEAWIDRGPEGPDLSRYTIRDRESRLSSSALMPASRPVRRTGRAGVDRQQDGSRALDGCLQRLLATDEYPGCDRRRAIPLTPFAFGATSSRLPRPKGTTRHSGGEPSRLACEVEAWDRLPKSIRKGILAMVDADRLAGSALQRERPRLRGVPRGWGRFRYVPVESVSSDDRPGHEVGKTRGQNLTSQGGTGLSRTCS